MLLQSSLHVPSRSVNSHLMEQMRDMQQKVTQLEKANRSHVDNEELQVQVSYFFVFVCLFLFVFLSFANLTVSFNRKLLLD